MIGELVFLLEFFPSFGGVNLGNVVLKKSGWVVE